MDSLKLILFLFGLFAVVFSEYGPMVTLKDGRLRGTIKRDRFNRRFYSFQRIPYAYPPIVVRRFKDPIPNEPWQGVLDATEDLPECFQENVNLRSTKGQEDCLYLNVYSPKLKPHGTLLPVMVWIHGGGFTFGSGRTDFYSPEYFMPEDVVLVTINYRLNIFGFFSLNDATLGTPGNAGLKDQRLALEWVQKNIGAFGGDRKRVTIFGQSLGGASVHMHVLSPQSEGLFIGAIIMSGTAIGPWMPGVPNNGELLAQVMEVSTDDADDMLTALQSYPANVVFDAYLQLVTLYPMRWGEIHRAIVETQTDGSAFLPEDPLTLIKEGRYNKVPLMIGYTDAEGIYFEPSFRSETGEPQPVTDYFEFVPDELGILPGTPEAELLAEEMQYFYQGDAEPSPENMQPFVDVLRDSWYAFPARRAALEHAKHSHTTVDPVYFYRFSALTELNVFKNRDEFSRTLEGASHADDIAYLFKTVLTPEIEKGSVEDKAIDRVVKLYTSFAKFSYPQTGSRPNCKAVKDAVLNYVDIGTTENVCGVEPDEKNMRFWLSIFERFGVQ